MNTRENERIRLVGDPGLLRNHCGLMGRWQCLVMMDDQWRYRVFLPGGSTGSPSLDLVEKLADGKWVEMRPSRTKEVHDAYLSLSARREGPFFVGKMEHGDGFGYWQKLKLEEAGNTYRIHVRRLGAYHRPQDDDLGAVHVKMIDGSWGDVTVGKRIKVKLAYRGLMEAELGKKKDAEDQAEPGPPPAKREPVTERYKLPHGFVLRTNAYLEGKEWHVGAWLVWPSANRGPVWEGACQAFGSDAARDWIRDLVARFTKALGGQPPA